jgi:hypothetical protein
MKRYWLFLAVLLAPGFTGQFTAQTVLFSNLLQPQNGIVAFDTLRTRLATDFLTDGSSSTISSITAGMVNTSSFITVTVTLSIFTDNGSGKPGSLVGNFDTPATIPPGGNGTFTATSVGISLQPNTIYWVVGQVNELGLGTTYWDYNLDEGTDSGSFSTVPSTQFQYSPNNGGFYLDNDTGNLLYELQGTSIPEPEMWLALLAGFGGFHYWTKRCGSALRA